MEKLEPCPFCGSVDITIKNIDDHGGWGGPCRYKIMCKHCFAEVDFHSGSEIDTLLKWNHRYEQPNEPLTLDELCEMDGKTVWVECERSYGRVISDGTKVSVSTHDAFYTRPENYAMYRCKPKEESIE